MTCQENLKIVAIWLWKLQNKPKLMALLDQHLPPEDAVQIRTDNLMRLTNLPNFS